MIKIGARAHRAVRRLGARLVTALIFDCDGVLADTERYGHLPAFNLMFEEFRLSPRTGARTSTPRSSRSAAARSGWRACSPTRTSSQRAGIPADDAARKDLLAMWHKCKTAIFKELVADGQLPPRLGYRTGSSTRRWTRGWTVAVCSTSAEESVRAVLERAVGTDAAEQVHVLLRRHRAGEEARPRTSTCSRVERLGLDKADTLVVEDSRNGLLAAHGGRAACLVTVNGYTRDEDFDEAALVVCRARRPRRGRRSRSRRPRPAPAAGTTSRLDASGLSGLHPDAEQHRRRCR